MARPPDCPRLLPFRSPARSAPDRLSEPARSSQPVSEQEFERKIEIHMRDPLHRSRIDRRRFEHRNVEKRGAPGTRARRADRNVADEELRALLCTDGTPDDNLHALSLDFLGFFCGGDNGSDGGHFHLRMAAHYIEGG